MIGFCIVLKFVFIFDVIEVSIVLSVWNLQGRLFDDGEFFCWSFF